MARAEGQSRSRQGMAATLLPALVAVVWPWLGGSRVQCSHWGWLMQSVGAGTAELLFLEAGVDLPQPVHNDFDGGGVWSCVMHCKGSLEPSCRRCGRP